MPDTNDRILRLTPAGDSLECRDHADQLFWTIRLADIVLMAEYTTSDGQDIDDYFLVFVTAEDGKQFYTTASFYSDGRDELIRCLSAYWKTDIKFGLTASTDWASRVIWPPRLADKEFLTIRDVAPKSLTEKLHKIAFGSRQEFSRSAEVIAFLSSLQGGESAV